MQNFITMAIADGMTARQAIKARDTIKIRPMSGPTILNRPCQLCANTRRPDAVEPSAWIYQPPSADGAVLTACDFHALRAARVYTLP